MLSLMKLLMAYWIRAKTSAIWTSIITCMIGSAAALSFLMFNFSRFDFKFAFIFNLYLLGVCIVCHFISFLLFVYLITIIKWTYSLLMAYILRRMLILTKMFFFLDSFLIILFLCRIKIFKQAFQNNHACGL
jgi:hypothetical protein